MTGTALLTNFVPRICLLLGVSLALGCSGADTLQGEGVAEVVAPMEASQASTVPEAPAASAPAEKAAAEPQVVDFATLGIEKTLLMPTALNTMIDFRFRVLDAERAGPVLRRGLADLVLVDQKSGQRLPVPVSSRVGPLRQTTQAPEVGRTYSLFFHNPGGMVRSGDRVTIQLEDRRTKIIMAEVRDVEVD